jgi:hypothetical protein
MGKLERHWKWYLGAYERTHGKGRDPVADVITAASMAMMFGVLYFIYWSVHAVWG